MKKESRRFVKRDRRSSKNVLALNRKTKPQLPLVRVENPQLRKRQPKHHQRRVPKKLYPMAQYAKFLSMRSNLQSVQSLPEVPQL
jgi:hypothetical protein